MSNFSLGSLKGSFLDLINIKGSLLVSMER